MENLTFSSDDGPATTSDGLLAPSDGSHSYRRLSSDNTNSDTRGSSVLSKKQILVGCLIGSSIATLLLIPVGLVFWMKLSPMYDATTTTTTTTTTNINTQTQSPTSHYTTTITTTILSQSSTTSTETLTSSPKSCPISAVNALWNTPPIVFINRPNTCSQNESSLCNPEDLFIDDIHDAVYVADAKNNRIQKYSLTEAYNLEIGATGITVASRDLFLPKSVFVDTQTEDMYILDFDDKETYQPGIYSSYRVHLWKKNEQVGRILLSEAGEQLAKEFPHRLTLDKEMNVYVGTRYFIRKWSASTNYTRNIAVAGNNQYNHPARSTDLWDPAAFFVTDDLTLYIADWQNKRIQKWAINATRGWTVIEYLSSVTGITMDCNGYLYYAESYADTIYQLNMKTNQKRMLVSNEDHFKKPISYFPTAIKIDKFGNFFLVGQNQVYKFSIIQK